MQLERWVTALLGGAGRRLGGETEEPGSAQVYAGAGRVVKLHAPGTHLPALRQRLVAASRLEGFFVSPLQPPTPAPGGRIATLWPLVEPLRHDELTHNVWRRLGVLLAGLHRAPAPPLPAARPLDRLARAAAALGAESGADDDADGVAEQEGLVLRGRPSGGDAAVPAVVHGDPHLGQVARTSDGLRLLDVDDLAVGDPAYDLGRFAGFAAAGLMPSDDWAAFLEGYRSADGPGVPSAGDPWPRLELPARAAVLTAAANALTGRRPYAGDERRALLDACRAMARSAP